MRCASGLLYVEAPALVYAEERFDLEFVGQAVGGSHENSYGKPWTL